MRKLSLFLTVILIASLPLGCTIARKPAPAKPQTQATPGVSTVSFTNVDPVRAPDVVQLLLEKNKTRDTSTLVNTGTPGIYVVATSARSMIRLRQVTQTVTTTGQNQLRVVFERTGGGGQSQVSGLAPTVLARLSLSRAPDAVSFEYMPLAAVMPQAVQKPAPSKAPTAPTTPTETISVSITDPKPGAEVQSPFSVAGTVSGKAELVRIRLLKGTQVLDSKEARVQNGSFQQTVQYSKPAAPMAGTLEVAVPKGGMTTLSLTLK